MNDATVLTLGIQYEALPLAAACVYCALKMSGLVKLPNASKCVKSIVDQCNNSSDVRFHRIVLTKALVEGVFFVSARI